MRDILSLSGGAVVGLITLMLQAYTLEWYLMLAATACIFLYSAAPILLVRVIPRSSMFLRSFWKRKIPIDVAARIAYEKAERANALYLVDSPSVAPENKLDHFKHAFMIDGEVTLFGIKPPSTALLPIPRDELSKLYPVSGLSQLNYITPFHQLAYANVVISGKDLRHIIRQYIPQARRAMRQFKRG